jgi:hypothetical protein
VAESRYVVYEGKRPRDPSRPLRMVRQDGSTVHVIREDALSDSADRSDLMPLGTAVREALRRAEINLA